MSKEVIVRWPLRPSESASVSHALCMAMADLAEEEGGGEVPRRTYLKMCALAWAAEVFSQEVSAFFGGQFGECEDMLTLLEEKWRSARD